MALVKKIKDRKVNIEFNKEFIKVINEKIKSQDTDFLANSLKELLPADSADIIENLSPENRSKLIELEGFNIDPEIFVELNESIQTEIFLLLSVESIASLLKKLESDNALKILENLDKSKKETVLNRLPPKDQIFIGRRFELSRGYRCKNYAKRIYCYSKQLVSRTNNRLFKRK